ncbi:MAG: deoxyribonuclease IV [Calditrichia bacterium]
MPQPIDFQFKNHPPLGAHTSIAGGLFNALHRGREIGCDVVQIFSKNQMQWDGKPLTPQEADAFKAAVSETGVRPVTVHDAYLINLGATNPRTWQRSRRAFTDELKRSELLGVPYLVMHPGSHLGAGEEAGMNKIADSLRQCREESGAQQVTVLLETTAGQGTNLGYRFEQLRYMMDRSGLGGKVGVCLDTCHVFAAGYDIRTKKGWQAVKAEFDRTIGLDRLLAFHVNDSKPEFGSRVDRHARIGQGEIGLAGFRHLINDPDFRNIPMILEVPGGDQAYKEDLQLLRRLIHRPIKKIGQDEQNGQDKTG